MKRDFLLLLENANELPSYLIIVMTQFTKKFVTFLAIKLRKN